MLYLFLLVFSFCAPLCAGGFTQRIYERLLLGSDLLAEVKQVCTTRGDERRLYQKLAQEPMPRVLWAVDKLFSESKEARLAQLWITTGSTMRDVLYGQIFFRPGAFAVWQDPDVQARLHALYGNTALTEFTILMKSIESLYNDVNTKIKSQQSWLRTLGYRTFSDSDLELKVILEHVLRHLVNLRLFINNVSPDLNNSLFQAFVPQLNKAVEILSSNFQRLESINKSSFQYWYEGWRSRVLHNAIMRCMPPLKPMAEPR
jgi:hypothetical protein